MTRFLQVPGEPDSNGVTWQYNSRSDRHSKVGCWGIAFDLLRTSALLRRHAETRKIVIGVNHTMSDFRTQRKKALDLVVARPSGSTASGGESLRTLADKYRVLLTGTERDELDRLPDIPVSEVGAVLIALEAKAAMTAHVKALPRLYDELNSSHLCVHGASEQALAIGYVQVNASREFVSSVRNARPGLPIEVTKHKQPEDTLRVLKKTAELPRRSHAGEVGFDGLGVSILELRNDGGPVNLVEAPPAPQAGDSFHYDSMIVRMAHEYDSRFRDI